jgi:hypothetical protein
MLLGRHLLVSLLALATAGVAAGCTGSDGGGGNNGAVMRATLTGDGCRYQGDTTPAPGTFTIEVRNETNESADFHLIALPAGTTLDDVETWFEETRRTYQQTGTVSLPHITWASSTLVEPHATSELPGNAPTGRFAVLCSPAGSLFSDANNPRFLSGIVAAAELDVTPHS